jgi:hypothetical protein
MELLGELKDSIRRQIFNTNKIFLLGNEDFDCDAYYLKIGHQRTPNKMEKYWQNCRIESTFPFFAPFVLQFKPTESLRLFLKMPIVAPCYATSYYDSLILTLSKNMTTLLLNYIYNKYFT